MKMGNFGLENPTRTENWRESMNLGIQLDKDAYRNLTEMGNLMECVKCGTKMEGRVYGNFIGIT